MATRSDELGSCGPSDAVSSVLSGCILDGDTLMLPNIQDSTLGDLPVQSPEDELILLPSTAVSEETTRASAPRKSDRERREKRSFSPDHQRSQYPSTARGRRRKATPRKLRRNDEADQQITCELCFSPYVTNPLNQHPTAKKSRYRQSWRNKVDRNTGKLMVLCNACGIAYDRTPKVSKAKPRPPPEEKERYLEEAQEFAASLVKELNDTDAERLSCPHFKTEGCGCLQRYIMANDNIEDSRNRAVDLLNLLKKAKELSQKKFYDPDKAEAEGKSLKRPRNIGLGNGQKRCKEFEEFVMLNRKILRDELMLCERATQRVLMYSNNFLHKKLKTETRSCRVERTKGKYVLGLLKPVASLVKEKCCLFRCVRMAVSLSSLLEEWRKRAASGQREARRVIAEMLTPSGGARPNCYNFIEMVTGCSFSTIGKVNEQMRKSGGSREPPAHGMCQYWKKHSTKNQPHAEGADREEEGIEVEEGEDRDCQQENMEPLEEGGLSLEAQEAQESAEAALTLDPFPAVIAPDPEPLVPISVEETQEPAPVKQLTTVELHNHRQQILALQKQLSQQQVQLQQQQQLLQQQMLHQVLLDQVNGTSGVHIQTLQSLHQLLNLQQQYQQQQLAQLTHLEEQAGIVVPSSSTGEEVTPTTATTTTAPAQSGAPVLGSAEFLQLPSSMTLPQLLPQLSEGSLGADASQNQQSIVLMQSLDSQPQLLQQQLQQHPLVLQTGTDSLLTTANLPGSDVTMTSPEENQAGVVTSETDDVLDADADSSANIESVVQIPVPSSSVSSVILPAINGKASCSSNSTQPAMLQQVIDLGQLGLGLQTLNPSQTSLLGADASQLLSNLNITLVQSAPGVEGAVSSSSVIGSGGIGSLPTTVMSASDVTDLTQVTGSASAMGGATEESLTQLLASSLGYTVLTIEPNMTVTDIETGTTDTTVTVGDKVTADTPMFVDLDPNTVVDSDVVINAPDASQVEKENIGEVGLKVLGESETEGDEEVTTEMSPSEVLQLLVQHGIAGQDRLINHVQ